jgi:long-chain acyl-CoA synthetase
VDLAYGISPQPPRGFAQRLRDEGIAPGQAIAIWSENRPEWIAALWGALLEGVVLVPIDYRTSPDFLLKVAGIVDAKAILVGDAVDASALGRSRRSGICRDLQAKPDAEASRNAPRLRLATVEPTTTAEIIFTSGATAEPKGSSSRTRTSSRTSSRSSARWRSTRSTRCRSADPVPQPAAAQPHVRPGDGDVRAADAAGLVVFTAATRPTTSSGRSASAGSPVLVCVPKILEVLRDYVIRVAPEAASRRPAGMHWAKRWWHYRRIHKMFGFKFWAMVVGAAPLDPELEAFWGRLGFLVVQGYGLTETAPDRHAEHPLTRSGRGRQTDRRRRDQDRRRRRDPGAAART